MTGEERGRANNPLPTYPLRGMQLRRHVAALWVQRLGCLVRGYHTPEWDDDWRDSFCSCCWALLKDEPDPSWRKV